MKVVLLGESGVGKSALATRICLGKFPHGNIATIGFEFLEKDIRIEDIPVTMQLWDTAGQERFRESLVPQYYK